jgi:CRP-like cAMP-binding protein
VQNFKFKPKQLNSEPNKLMEQIRTFLENYAPLTDEEWNLLLTKTLVYKLKAGEFLLTEGKVCTVMGFVESGVLRTYYVDKLGKEKSMFFHFEKTPISDYESFIKETPSKCYIQAINDSVIYTINRADREFLMHKYHAFEKINRKMIERFYLFMVDRLKDFTFLSAEERYLKLVQKRPDIFQKLPLSYISDYINIKPQSLSRIRKKLAQRII